VPQMAGVSVDEFPGRRVHLLVVGSAMSRRAILAGIERAARRRGSLCAVPSRLSSKSSCSREGFHEGLSGTCRST